MWVTAVLVGLFVYLVARWIRLRQSAYTTFRQMGLPGPSPGFFFGNQPEIREKGFHGALKEWREEYGKTYGYFEASRPILVTSDLDILQEIMIRQFSKFHGRKRFRIDGDTDKYQDMFIARGEKWKKLRTISSQLFLAKRMKEMSPIIHNVIDRVMDIMGERERSQQPFDIHELYQCMTMEVIGNVAFGIETNALNDPKDEFLRRSRWIFSLQEKPPRGLKLIGMVGALFPSIYGLIRVLLLGVVFEHPSGWFRDIAKTMIDDRIKSKHSDRVDFIQLMLNARATGSTKWSDLKAENVDDEVATENADVTKKAATNNTTSSEKKAEVKLTMEEMQAQCMLFLLAGYETTSTALGFLMYELAKNPDVQHTLVEEIDDHFQAEDAVVDSQSVQKLPYLDMVIKESLRRHTIAALATTRCTMENAEINGIPFPYGLDVQINPEDIHMDPEYWGPEDPSQFVPERFTKDRIEARHPLAWMPFGAGPRNCVGMRFALMELKIALVRLFRVYNVEKCDKTPLELPTTKHGIKGPSEGVYVKIVKRSH